MPETKVFLDTNIIIYAYDVSAKEKHEQARKILVDLWNSGRGVLSTQVLQEFFVSVTQKIPQPLTLIMAKEIISDLLRWEIVVNDGDSILEAIELHSRHKYSFWDSLIIQAAIKGGASLLLSEDLSGGQTIHGLAIKNPFKSPLTRFSEG
jgi:predicted nucleic acid-binding protein